MPSGSLSSQCRIFTHSPSAEVRGHGRGQEVLQTGKRYVAIKHIESVGNYAIKLSLMTVTTAAFTAGTTCLSWERMRVRSGRTTLLNCSKPVRRASRFRLTPSNQISQLPIRLMNDSTTDPNAPQDETTHFGYQEVPVNEKHERVAEVSGLSQLATTS